MGRLAEVGIDEGWRIEWIPGNWMSHQRCAGWRGGKAEFPCGMTGGGPSALRWTASIACVNVGLDPP